MFRLLKVLCVDPTAFQVHNKYKIQWTLPHVSNVVSYNVGPPLKLSPQGKEPIHYPSNFLLLCWDPFPSRPHTQAASDALCHRQVSVSWNSCNCRHKVVPFSDPVCFTPHVFQDSGSGLPVFQYCVVMAESHFVEWLYLCSPHSVHGPLGGFQFLLLTLQTRLP